MKTKKLFALAATAVAITMSPVASAAEMTLSAASCFPIGSPPSVPFEKLVDEINEKGKGVLKINLKGGAPAIGSPFTLTQKMSKGVYDMVGCPEAYFGNVLPEAPVLRLTERTYAELRKNGGMDKIAGLMADKGMHYVGRHHNFGPFYTWLNKKIDKPDLTGLHMRVSPVYTAFYKSLGATVQTSNIAQIYTYMENGTVQGYGWPALGWVPSWVKVTKYRVEPGFYAASLHTLVNMRKWKTLGKEQQELLTQMVLKREAVSDPGNPVLEKKLADQNKKTAAEGLTAITFDEAGTKKWLKAASDAGWAEVLDRSKEHGEELKKLFTK